MALLLFLASLADFFANPQLSPAILTRHLSLTADGPLVAALLLRPPPVVFALSEVVIALETVDPFLIEVPGVLLAVLGQLPAPVRRALVLELPLLVAFGTLLFPAQPAGVGVGGRLLVVEVALVAVAAALVSIEIGLVPVEPLLLFFAVTDLAHGFTFPKLTGRPTC